ncbi:uncharacterized protein LOC127721212 isoform X2 [Mytilus californianus]|uniref:uncharacterized protein LOC127721212 isoform X2 n=1 Tax=Mytilus californianus TaxID=6549 RepID=UPI00224708B0|nr:uncharacterized protein LOC127721212 isoform X2 [Mytilus californianus]XP_052083859.1 uncharacterized protein LOC127721212 isoform X2 [Mytilus californianus]
MSKRKHAEVIKSGKSKAQRTDSQSTMSPEEENVAIASNMLMHTASPKTMYSDEVDNGIWLFDVLNTIGVNEVYRKVRQQQGIIGEILESFQEPITTLNMGSTFEGTDSPGEPSDMDVMRCDESFSVIEDMANATEKDGILSTLLIVRELHTPPGYVKLQLVNGETLYTSKHWTMLSRKRNMNVFKIDREERIVLSDHLLSGNPEVFKRTKNKPADVTVGKFAHLKTDIVFSYRCKSWPTIANEWLYRYRLYGWPSKDTIEELKSLGFFVVRKGHPFSPENDLEWRISLSLQERQLMFNLTDVQHKCYVVLKMLNRDVINFDCITTYHWKTCLFYAIEENNGNIWEKKTSMVLHKVVYQKNGEMDQMWILS